MMAVITAGPKETAVGDGTAPNTGTGVETSSTDTPFVPGGSFSNQEKETQVTRAGPPTAPDGGFQAWIQVLGGFFIYFNTW